MATYTGKLGVVESGAAAIACVTDFSYTDTVAVTGDNCLGASWLTNKSGVKSWSGTVNCSYDHTDTTGQGTLVVGAEVTLSLYAVDDSATNNKRSGLVIIDSVAVTNGGNDAIVSVSFTFTGSGTATDEIVV